MDESSVTLPTEIILQIFKYLSPKALVKCRQVCRQWKDIYEECYDSERFWYYWCRKDFASFKASSHKMTKSMNWFETYKSISLWPKIATAKCNIIDFAIASTPSQEISDFVILDDGVIGLHTHREITYYDIETKNLSLEYNKISGTYLRYTENTNVLIILGTNLTLYINQKITYKPKSDTCLTYGDVKNFLLNNLQVFFVTLNNSVYLCDVSKDSLQPELLFESEEDIMCLSYIGKLYILTYGQKIKYYENGELNDLCSLETESLDILNKYNFLNNLDWRVYMQWRYVWNRTIPNWPLRDITVVFVYGNNIFVGTSWGLLCLYNFTDTFEFFTSNSVRQWNFMEREDCPVLTMCPIIQINVIETINGHTIIAAMPKKLVAIELKHSEL